MTRPDRSTPREVAESILQQGMTALSASAAILFELQGEPATLVMLQATGYPPGDTARFARIPVDAPLPAAEAIRQRSLVLLETPEALRQRFPAVGDDPRRPAAIACVPLVADGETVGLIALTFDGPRAFGEPDVAFMRALGSIGALALKRATEQEQERRARERMAFLARASHVLSESLDADVTLRRFAQLAVPELADWCTVDVPADAGRRRSVAVAHADPARVALAEELRHRYPPGDGDESPVDAVLRTGESLYLREIPPERIAEIARDEEHLRILGELGLRSALIVPVCANERTLAAISLISTDRLFEPDDLDFAEELGRRMGLALDNARLHEEVQAGQARLMGILGSAMDAIITIDEAQRVILFNAAAEQLFGYSADEMVGRSVSELIPERFREAHAGHVRRFAETGVTKRAMGSLGTLWGLRRSGDEFPLEATISKLHDRGQLLSTVILRDVTDRLAKERQLEEAVRHKDQFLAMLGHELRNPLAAIRHAVDLQHLEGAPAGSDLATSGQVIERQVEHMTRLIDDLLDVSRIARGKIELRRGAVDLREVVRMVVTDHAELSRRAGIELTQSLGAAPAWVEGDEARLVQVLGNLVNNAIKFTEPGGTVRLSSRRDGDAQVLEVTDSGIGIEPGVIERLFEPFRQADASLARTRGGLGLGLAVARGIVELHGGAIEASSPGLRRGSTFTVRLPAGTPPRRRKSDRPAARGLPFRRILVVEDNEDAALLLGLLLERLGAETLTAHTGEEGLALVRSARPEVVICDIGLPGALDGYRVAEAVRSEEDLAGTLLVALTGYGLPEDVARARDAGFDAHLTKPVDITRVSAVLRDLAGRRSAS